MVREGLVLLTGALLQTSGGCPDVHLDANLSHSGTTTLSVGPRSSFQLVFMERLIKPVCVEHCGVHGAISNTFPRFRCTKACEVGQVLISPAFTRER